MTRPTLGIVRGAREITNFLHPLVKKNITIYLFVKYRHTHKARVMQNQKKNDINFELSQDQANIYTVLALKLKKK